MSVNNNPNHGTKIFGNCAHKELIEESCLFFSQLDTNWQKSYIRMNSKNTSIKVIIRLPSPSTLGTFGNCNAYINAKIIIAEVWSWSCLSFRKMAIHVYVFMVLWCIFLLLFTDTSHSYENIHYHEECLKCIASLISATIMNT